MKNKLSVFLITFLIFSCTLIPSNEYMKSDTLESNLKVADIIGRYLPSEEAIEKLKKIFTSKQIDSLKKSFIYISSKDSIIIGKNIPLNLSFEGNYKISSGKRKIYILRNNHEKFRFIPRPDDKYPEMHFRKKNDQKCILVNLSLDPDGWDYYEYQIQEN
jgi:hypothetical protein